MFGSWVASRTLPRDSVALSLSPPPTTVTRSLTTPWLNTTPSQSVPFPSLLHSHFSNFLFRHRRCTEMSRRSAPTSPSQCCLTSHSSSSQPPLSSLSTFQRQSHVISAQPLHHANLHLPDCQRTLSPFVKPLSRPPQASSAASASSPSSAPSAYTCKATTASLQPKIHYSMPA